MLKKIVSEKETLFIYPGDNGNIAYLNNYFKDVGKQIQYSLDISTENTGKIFNDECITIHISDLVGFDKDKIAIFIPRYQSSYDIERQLRRYELVHNHHYFFIEDFALYPIREDYFRPAAHAPWSMDHDFIDVYNKMRKQTLLGVSACYELKSLLEQVAHLDGNVLEVGVFHGGSGFLLASYASRFNKKVFLADTFRGFVNADHKFDRGITNHDKDAKDFSSYARNLFSEVNPGNYEFLVGSFPEETGHLIESEKFCFCHIDTDLYWAVRNPTEWIWDKLCVGGVIVYDDYGHLRWDGATRFIDEIKQLKDRLFIYNMNGQGIIVKTQ